MNRRYFDRLTGEQLAPPPPAASDPDALTPLQWALALALAVGFLALIVLMIVATPA